MIEVRLSHELYQAAESMYLSLDLPRIITDLVSSLDPSLHRRLLSNIVLTGGNSRLNGLSVRLVRDLESLLPTPLASCVHIVDPRLMTGRSDAVIGAAYVRKWCHAKWTTRVDYILTGVGDPSSDVGRSPSEGVQSPTGDDSGSVDCSSAATTAVDVIQQLDISESCSCHLNDLDSMSDLCHVNKVEDTDCHYSQYSDSSHAGLSDEIVSNIL